MRFLRRRHLHRPTGYSASACAHNFSCLSVIVNFLLIVRLAVSLHGKSSQRRSQARSTGVPIFRRHSVLICLHNLSTVCKQAFPVSGPNFWNSLPPHVSDLRTVARDIYTAY